MKKSFFGRLQLTGDSLRLSFHGKGNVYLKSGHQIRINGSNYKYAGK
jgi:hypothetical protein